MIADLVDAAVERMEHPYQTESTKLGWSKIETYMQCGRRYYYQYVSREQRKPNIAAVFGSCVHDTIAAIHRLAWDTSNAAQAADLLQTMWERTAPDDKERPKYDLLANEAALRWIPWYLQWIGDQVTVATEERWSADLKLADRTVQMEGTWDRLYREDGATVISDIKTGSNIPPLPSSGQLSLYAWAYRQTTGRAEGALEIVNIRQLEPLRAHRTDQYLEDFIANTVVPVVKSIEQGIYPCNPGCKYGCGFCGYAHLCPVGGVTENAN